MNKKCEININNHSDGKVFINCNDNLCHDNNKKIRYNMTYLEYVALNYFSRVDYKILYSIFLDNRENWLVENKADEFLFCQYITQNLNKFVDLDLYIKIKHEARNIYGCQYD